MSLYKALDRIQTVRKIERSEQLTCLASRLALLFNHAAKQLRSASPNEFAKQKTGQAYSLNQLVKRSAKFSNPAYLAAIDLRKNNELQWRLQRILTKLRPRYSTDSYAELLKAIAQMDSTEIENFVSTLDSNW